MCGKNLMFWWFCALLFIASSSKHQLKSTSNEEIDDNLTIRYVLDENFMTNYSDETETLRYDLYEKSINNTQNDELLTSSTSNDREDGDLMQYELGTLSIKNHENDSHMLIEFRINSTKVNSKKNSRSQRVYRDLRRLNDSMSNETSIGETEPSKKENHPKRMSSIDKEKSIKDSILDLDSKITLIILRIASVLLLLGIFLVYSILPGLRNAHGFMLRNYSGALSVAYTLEIVDILIEDLYQDPVCGIIDFVILFYFLASFFWLNVMSFDMWWTFRGSCSLQKNVRQGEKKKLVFYTIYAWCFPSIFAIISAAMGLCCKDLTNIFRPEFFGKSCWFVEKKPLVLYYYGFMSICIISSICLSISTALKIARYKKDTDHRLTDSESKVYNNNKKWFNLYLKLFIVQFILMGIKLFMTAIQIILVSCLDELNIIPYVIALMDIMQNLCTFIIFVWKKNIKLMLQKRFSCGLFPEARCGTNATSSSTCTTTSEEMSI